MDDRTNILVVEKQNERRQMLVDLIEREIRPGKCFEAEDANTATENIEQYSVSFAIVESHPRSNEGKKTAENIKLRCPMLPVLEVLIERDEFNCVNVPKKDISQYEINRIIAGIRYMESLKKAGISGFTVEVNI